MRKILNLFFLLIILGTLYQYRAPLGKQFLLLRDNLGAFFAKTPCLEPMPYALGSFDPKFGISQKYFFDVLKINLIYDFRQQATSKLASLGIIVKNDRTSYDMLKAKFTALKAEYAAEKNAYDMQVADFNRKQQAYEAEVSFWNKKGGAPRQEYNKVEAERLALEAESKKLQAAQLRINNMVDEINALVVALNRLVASLNLSVDSYNTVNVSRGESFEEGVYTSDGSNREIDIYEFSSRAKLVRVLAHELGHALNLDHVDDAKAIMYKFNQGNNSTLTQADLAELNIKCQVK
ncbi:hypothetical protein A3D43_01400 [Candidatus Nomurabacteria bacterium RIFCSPHIGHO2_02_FULL_41_52]|nr:MAG: hypothetical protein A3D43_01400 [Candidatus Nomurabacteria bacterium RIFCSPHIGHO2_02_FULL_41_52]